MNGPEDDSEKRESILYLLRYAKLANKKLQGGKPDEDCYKLLKMMEKQAGIRKRTIDQSAGGKLRDLNPEESWAILEDLALYDNKSWNDPRDFAKLVKAIALPQDVPSTSDRRLIELENQVQRLMETYLAPTQPTQVNKITTPCEICNGPHDTQNCMESPEQAFVEYASSRTDEACWEIYCKRLNIGSITNSDNSYLRDILGDILGKDMHYPFTPLSSSKGDGYGFSKKEHEQLFTVYATQLVEKEHSHYHALLQNDKIIQPSQSTALSTHL
ncbi:hypothetical protein Tco_1375372 [Tanacetum coccineum]